MNVLLVNPYITDFTAYDLWLRPLGLLSIASVIQRYTDCRLHWLDVLDRFSPELEGVKISDDGRGKFSRHIIEKPPIYRAVPRHYARYGMPLKLFLNRIDALPEVDCIFMTSLMTYWQDGVAITLKYLKQRFPRAKTVLGGVLPTLAPKAAEKLPVDHIISGYGEKAVLEILAGCGAGIRSHPGFQHIEELPLPAWELLANHKILPLLTSRGCPLKCRYCATRLLNPGFQERSADSILFELGEMERRYSPREVVIFDDALLVNQNRRFLPVFQNLKPSRDRRFHTPNGLHAAAIQQQTADTLFQSGFTTVRLGFESTRSRLLRSSDWKVSIPQMRQAVVHLERAGYRRSSIEVYLLFGYPSQTAADIREALSFSADLGVVPRLSFFSPVPGTPEFKHLVQSGILSPDIDLYETNKTYFVYRKSGLKETEIQALKAETAEIARRA